MNVAFDSRPMSDPQGVGRYSRCMLQALQRDRRRERADRSRRSRPRRADLFHAPWMTGALLHSPCPMVVTLHDLSSLKRRSELLRAGARLRLRQLAVQRAVRVIVPTEALAHDALEHLGLEREQIDVIAEAPASCMYPRSACEIAETRARFDLPERYLLWVGGLRHPDPDKHVAKLAATPRELPLVLVGQTSPWAHELPGVILTGHVSDDHLAALYSGAHALVVASHDEGFGLPAVEALACGTPVVACEVAAAARGARRARHVRASRRPARAHRRRRSRRAPCAGAARVDLAGRRPRHVERLRARARAGRPPAHDRPPPAPPSGRRRRAGAQRLLTYAPRKRAATATAGATCGQ